jgi:hypothetical protein
MIAQLLCQLMNYCIKGKKKVKVKKKKKFIIFHCCKNSSDGEHSCSLFVGCNVGRPYRQFLDLNLMTDG